MVISPSGVHLRSVPDEQQPSYHPMRLALYLLSKVGSKSLFNHPTAGLISAYVAQDVHIVSQGSFELQADGASRTFPVLQKKCKFCF